MTAETEWPERGPGKSDLPASPEEGELEAFVGRLFEEGIPFNRLLGVRVESLDPDRPEIRFRPAPEHVGNVALGSLHGGVTSAVLDTVGGLAAILASLREARRAKEEEGEGEGEGENGDADGRRDRRGGVGDDLRKRLERIGTIDLRVDYLRPAVEEEYLAVATVLRTGKRVVVTRMELVAPDGRDVAVGTGTYIVS